MNAPMNAGGVARGCVAPATRSTITFDELTKPANFCSGSGIKHTAKHGKPYSTVSFADIRNLVDEPQRVKKDDARWAIPSTLASRDHAEQREHGQFGMLIGDVDTGAIALESLSDATDEITGGANYEIWATYSATKEEPRFKVAIPLAQLLPFATWRAAQEALVAKFAAHGITLDISANNAGQVFYLPNRGTWYVTASNRDEFDFDPAATWAAELEAAKFKAEDGQRRAKTKTATTPTEDNGDEPIARFNSSSDVREILLRNGYIESKRKPGNFNNPNSKTKTFATQIVEAGRVFSLSESDLLYTGGPGNPSLSPFDVLMRLEHGGDVKKAWAAIAKRDAVEEFAEPPTHRAPPPEELVPPHLPEPYPGAHAALVQAVTKSMYIVQADLANLAVLVAMASALPGSYRYSDGLRPNLYGAVLADTAEGKERPLNAAQFMAQRFGAKTCSKPASGEALEDQLVSGQGMLVLFREAGHIFSVMAGKNAAPYHVSLAGNLLDFFSASERVHEKRVRAAIRGQREVEVEVIPYPMTNVLLASTPDKLGEALTSDNIKDGLLGRVLFAFGRKDAPRNPDCEDFDGITLDFTKPAVEAQAAVIRWSMKAESARHPIEDANLARKRALQAQGDAIEAALIGRSFDKAKRIAGVLAVWDNASDPVVTMPMLEWAIAFVKASDDGLRVFIRKFMHDSAVHADTQKIIAAMRRVHAGSVKPMTPSQFALVAAGHLPRTMVLKSSGLEPKRFDEAMKLLEGTEQAKQYRVNYKQGLKDESANAIAFC